MGERVVADDVACVDNLAGNLGALLNVASDQKKSCLYVVSGENLQQPLRVRVVGAVIVGKRELFRPAGEACKGPAVPLSGGRHRLISRGNSAERGGSSQSKAEHAGIVID